MKVRKSQDGKSVLGGKLRATSCPQTDKCPPHSQTAQDGLSRDSKNLQRTPHWVPLPGNLVHLPQEDTLYQVSRQGDTGRDRWGQKPGDAKRKGTCVGSRGDRRNSSEDEHAGYEIRKQSL